MGHVSPLPVPEEGGRPHRTRRLRRGDGAGRADLSRADLGALGEAVAIRFLARRGVSVVASNVSVGRGELDLLGFDRGERTVFEVRSVRGMAADPLDAFDGEKREQVRRLASKLGVSRVDFVGVAFRDDVVELRWVPRC